MKVWDRKAGDGGDWVEMLSLNAKEACARDPGRYSLDQPNDKPKEVEHFDAAIPEVPFEIPSGWESLSWQDRRKLALTLGAEKNVDAKTAGIIIAAEVKRRAASAPAAEPAPEPVPETEAKESTT